MMSTHVTLQTEHREALKRIVLFIKLENTGYITRPEKERERERERERKGEREREGEREKERERGERERGRERKREGEQVDIHICFGCLDSFVCGCHLSTGLVEPVSILMQVD